MEILERYLYAVGRWLPKKQRKDIQDELKSSVLDTLESAYGKKETYTDDEVSQVIKDLGSPWKVAAGYTGLTDRLIGPELLPIYYTITAIVAGAVSLGLLISFIVGIFRPDMDFKAFALRFLELIPTLVITAATVVGFTTIVFALIEKKIPDYRLKTFLTDDKGISTLSENDLKWSPKDLPAVPKGKIRIPRWESILAMVFSVVAIVIFYFFRENIGIYYTTSMGSGWEFLPIMSESAVIQYLPFWITVWIFTLIFSAYQLAKGRWTLPMRILDLVKSILEAAVLIVMIKGPELIDMRLLLSHTSAETSEALTPLAELFNYSINIFLIVGLVGTLIGAITKIVYIFKPTTHYETGKDA